MKKLTGSFRSTAWDPILLTAQIIAVQSLLYLSLSFLMAVMQDVTGSERRLDHIFQYQAIHVRNGEGQGVIVVYVFNAIVGALTLWFVVGRTKLCLDFSCTYHGLHLLSCWIYNSTFPVSLSWWCLNVACGVITCVSAELLCLKTELRDIPLAMGAKVDL